VLRNTDENPVKKTGGTFIYDRRTGEIFMSSGGIEVLATRFGDELTAEQFLPGLGTYKLTFRFQGRVTSPP
jgi:hypothetical protein